MGFDLYPARRPLADGEYLSDQGMNPTGKEERQPQYFCASDTEWPVLAKWITVYT